MAQPQPHVPQRVFSPAQNSPPLQHTGVTSPPPQTGFSVPAAKKPKLSPGPSPSPFATPAYPLSPAGNVTTPGTATSPSYQPLQAASPQPGYQRYHHPYTNGTMQQNTPIQPSTPNPLPTSTPPILPNATSTPTSPYPQYTHSAFAAPSSHPAPPTPGAMGPPSKPAERPLRESDYDVSDSLAGTGINIREEESNLAEYYAGTYGQDARTGFPANVPGDGSSFFGAGLANQAAQPGKDVDQKVAEAAAAERAWNESATRLATLRAHEQNNRFLQFATVHFKADKIAKEFGLTLNLDQKNPQGPVKARSVVDYPPPKVTVDTKVGPDGAMITTYGSVLPPESYLIDQLALLSLAAKHRIRELVEDADKIATTRQQTSHGAIPAEWADAAAPLTVVDAGLASEASPRTGVESAVSPRTNPLKRSFEASQSQNSATEAKATQNAPNLVAQAMREIGKADRDAEEARLRKRQKRQQGDVSTAPSRAGSVAPATPGSVAPEPEKAPTKKELKKNAQAKLADASNAANVNKTTMAFLGGIGKKKGKSYSWMSGGASSGASTPSRIQTQGLPGTPGATPAPKAPEDTRLTQEGRHKLGTWREYSEKGKNIQLRDWIVVLERDGRERASLQFAYNRLDDSEPK